MTIPNTPQARESLMTIIISFYREAHNRDKGKPCECGVCRIALKMTEELGVDISVNPQRFTGTTPDDAFALFKKVGDESAK